MKKILFILLLSASLTATGQFNPPINFSFTYDYIMLGHSGYCAGNWVYGPTYCSHFTWEPPDTTNPKNNTPESYNLYYLPLDETDTIILASVPDTNFDMEIGIIGDVWVTAVYTNPDGESEPSNIITNLDLPITVDEYQARDRINVFYDDQLQQIRITNKQEIAKIKVYNYQGKLILTRQSPIDNIDMKLPGKSLYIVEILTNYQKLLRKKILN